MTNNIQIIFDQSDLRIQENLNPKNLKIIFGVEDEKPPVLCDINWYEIEGDNVDISCECVKTWVEEDGDNINIDCPKQPNKCDPKWNTENITDFNCGCAKSWDDSNNDFTVDCSTEPTSSDLGTVRVYQGEYSSFTINGLEVFTANDGQEVNTELDIRRTILEEINTYDGQEVNTNIQNNRVFPIVSNSGEYTYIDLKYSPIANFDVAVHEGQEINAIINNQYSFESNGYIGEYANADLKNYPSIIININVYEGQYSNNTLITTTGFISNCSVGESVDVNLTIPDIGRMDFNVYEGQTTDFVLGVSQNIPINIYDGNSTDVSITVYYNLQMENYVGEEVNINFYQPSTFIFPMNVYEGQTANTILNVDIGFDVNVSEGQYVDSKVEFDPYKGYPIDMYEGQSVNFQLNSIHELTNVRSEIGEVVDTVLTTYPSFRMNVDVYEGQEVKVKPMFTVILGRFNAYEGQEVKIDLTETPNYVVEEGQEINIELSTESLITASYTSGDHVSIGLKYGEPVNLGSVLAYEGINVSAKISTMISTAFNVHFTSGSSLFIDQWATIPYQIDLDNRRCCKNIMDDISDIELAEAPYPWTRYDFFAQACEKMTFELSTRRTFKFNSYEGSNMIVDDKFNTFEINVYEGTTTYSRDLVTEHYIDLEEGNLIPDGDITIEIDRPLIPSEFKYTAMYDGQHLSFKLGVPYAVNCNMYSAETMTLDMILNPALRPIIYVGETVNVVLSTNVQIPTRVNDGQEMKVRVYEEPFVVYEGQYVEVVLETKSDYYAEFVSGGCIDNQYTETGENGQPIPPEFGGANVEGEKFLNYIEGRCF